jgi:D-hexose-6-phosphate mutarotase
MLCIETANIGDNEVTIPPGQTHTMGVSIRVES